MSIGSRLREEREKLNMNQEDFATACGVRRRAQSSYESGARSPDANYLEAASKIGADISYVIYGEKHTFKSTLKHKVLEDLFFLICFELGYTDEDAMSLLNNSLSTAHELLKQNKEVDGIACDLTESVEYFLKQCPRLSHDALDSALLVAILEQVDIILLEKKISLQSDKKALAVAMLYRAFRASRKIDTKMIEEALNLASQSAA